MSPESEEMSLDDGRVTFEEERPSPLTLQRDPVCGMEIDPTGVAATREHKGKTYYFCTTICRAKFDEDPARYVG